MLISERFHGVCGSKPRAASENLTIVNSGRFLSGKEADRGALAQGRLPRAFIKNAPIIQTAGGKKPGGSGKKRRGRPGRIGGQRGQRIGAEGHRAQLP